VSYGFASGIIGEEIFSAVVIVSLMTIVLSPLIFKWGLSLLGPRVDQPMPIEPD
jgi:Kef-type K+ transport system membrane component KefB